MVAFRFDSVGNFMFIQDISLKSSVSFDVPDFYLRMYVSIGEHNLTEPAVTEWVECRICNRKILDPNCTGGVSKLGQV